MSGFLDIYIFRSEKWIVRLTNSGLVLVAAIKQLSIPAGTVEEHSV